MEILNGCSGLGINTLNWDRDKHSVTHVEINEEVAEECRRIHPQDKVVKKDAYEYIKENHREYDFIWVSPPCQTHSRMNKATRHDTERYPDLRLYEVIIFLKHFFEGDWVVENVVPYYEPLIPGKKVSRHMFWSNFAIPEVDIDTPQDFSRADKEVMEEWLGVETSKNIYLDGNHDPAQVLRNGVHPKIGEEILKSRKTKQESVVSFGETEQ